MKDKPKTQVLTQEQFNIRLDRGVCPVCVANGDRWAGLVKRGRVNHDPVTHENKFAGFYYECEDYGHTHYNLSPSTEKNPPRETVGAALPVQARSSGVTGPAGVIRRKKK